MDNGHLHVAEILVKNGADVNYRNNVRALIPVTQVCMRWPMISHGIIIDHIGYITVIGNGSHEQ